MASLCVLEMQSMVGTMGGVVCGCGIEAINLCGVAVFLPMHTMCVTCQSWSSCVRCQFHIVVSMSSVWVLMRCGLFVYTWKGDAMRWFLFDIKCKTPAMDSPFVRGYIAVPSVAVHAVGFTGGVHNVRLRGLYMQTMHTTLAACTNCGMLVL